MLLTLISILAIFLCIKLYIQWNKVKTYWKKKGVPYYPPHPIMGSLTFFQRENPVIWMRRYNDFKSSYVGMWLFWRPALLVNCPEISKRILVKHSDNFRNHFVSSGKTDPIGSLNVITIKDPAWTKLRRRLTGALTNAKLKTHNRVIQDKTKDLIQRITEETAKSNQLHLRKLLADYTIDIIGESAFGIKSESVKTGDSIVKQVAKEFTDYTLFRRLSWFSIFFFPELVDIFRFSLYPKSTIERLRLICRSVIQKRGDRKEIKDPTDLLDTLIKMKQVAAAEGEELSEDFLLAQASVFLAGGFDTTAVTLTWIVYVLAWHPEYQQKLYNEVLNMKLKNTEDDLDQSVLSELTYCNCVIKETLRMYSPMGWLDRVATNDYQIDETLTIPAGTPVYINTLAIQMNPQYYPDPMVFNPDRWLPENQKNIPPFTFMPFGEGPRACLGIRFAYHVIRQALTSVVYNFEIRAVPGAPKPTEVHVEKQGLFIMPVDDRMVVEILNRKH